MLREHRSEEKSFNKLEKVKNQKERKRNVASSPPTVILASEAFTKIVNPPPELWRKRKRESLRKRCSNRSTNRELRREEEEQENNRPMHGNVDKVVILNAIMSNCSLVIQNFVIKLNLEHVSLQGSRQVLLIGSSNNFLLQRLDGDFVVQECDVELLATQNTCQKESNE